MSVKAWSDEEEKELISLYQQTKDIEEIALKMNKGNRSVISKLVQLKIYEKPLGPQTDKGKTVKGMLRDLEKMLDITLDGTNLNKKENLKNLAEAIEKLYNKV